MDTQRLIALIVFTFSGLMLWEAWNKHNRPPTPPGVIVQPQGATGVPAGNTEKAAIPVATPNANAVASAVPQASGALAAPAAVVAKSVSRILVTTDVLALEVDTQGGDIRSVSLLKHPLPGKKDGAFNLMQDKVGSYFIAQSGLLGPGLPNHTSIWTATGQRDK